MMSGLISFQIFVSSIPLPPNLTILPFFSNFTISQTKPTKSNFALKIPGSPTMIFHKLLNKDGQIPYTMTSFQNSTIAYLRWILGDVKFQLNLLANWYTSKKDGISTWVSWWGVNKNIKEWVTIWTLWFNKRRPTRSNE